MLYRSSEESAFTVDRRADLAKDDQLASVAGRQAAHDELDDAIGAWAATVAADVAFHALQRAGVAAAPLLDDPDLDDVEYQRLVDEQIAVDDYLDPQGNPY